MDIKIESDDESDFMGFSPSRQTDNEEIDEAIALAKQLHVYKPGIEFVPGSKLEVLDARDNNWYLCKVVEVDWGELDILVHYEKWSVRFDEWLKMDSTRIRPAKAGTRDIKKTFYAKENVNAYWAPDGRYYPAEIVKQVNEDSWNVLFFDGFTKALRPSHLKKLEFIEESKPAPENIPPKVIAEPQINIESTSVPKKEPEIEEQLATGNIFDVKIIEEKRKSKRNPAVDKLFQSIRKRRRSEKDDEEEVYHKPIKRFKPMNQTKLDDHDSSFSKSSGDETSTDEYTSDVASESDYESSESFQSADTKSSKKKLSIKNIKDVNSGDSIKIGTFIRSHKEEGVHFSSCSLSSPSTSTEDLGFKGFDEASLSTEKYHIRETLSALLEIPIQKGTHLCPKAGCSKSFRKENLLRMHMKHYHPKLFKHNKVLTPNETPYSRTVEDHFDNVTSTKCLQTESHVELKELYSDELTVISNGTNTNPLSQKPLKEYPHRTEGKRHYISSLKNKITSEKNSPQEFRYRKNRNTTTSECLSESDVQDFATGRTRNCKRKGSGNIKTAQLPVETEESTMDSLDKSDTVEKSDPDAIINCRCGFREEDGLMLQCDICLCWQHGNCYHIENEDQVPNSYICSICENSHLQRPSMRFRHHQDWLKEGKLPRFSGTEGSTRLESLIKMCHELMGNVLSVSDVMHSLDLKLYISKKEDHPKLVMWHEKWQDEQESDQLKNNFNSGCLREEIPSQLEGINKFKGIVNSVDCKDQFKNGIGEQLHHMDRLTSGVRINGSSSHQDCLTDAIKIPNEIYSNQSTPNYKPEKRDIEKFDIDEPTSTGVIDEFTKKEEKSDLTSKVDEVVASGSAHRNDNYSDWKTLPSEMALTNKIKVKVENSDEATSLETESESKEKLNLELRTYSKKEPVPDDQKEAIIDEVFDFSLPGLVNEGNVDPDLTDLLSSNVELERFVHQSSIDLAPMGGHQAPVMQRAPIIPQAERILPVKCKLNLLDHIEKMQNRLFDKFDVIEDHLQVLESEMGLTSKFSSEEEILCNENLQNRDEITIQARALVRMSLRDLETASKLISYKAS